MIISNTVNQWKRTAIISASSLLGCNRISEGPLEAKYKVQTTGFIRNIKEIQNLLQLA